MTRRLREILRSRVLLAWLGADRGRSRSRRRRRNRRRRRRSTTGASNLWLVAGGAFATLRGDCQTCEEDYPYRHSGSVLANGGYRVNDRMDVGGEVFWMPVDTDDGRIRTTHLDAVAQFRPWASQGFFVKGGAGMAFVRNWVDAIGPDPINSKALSVVIGAGWEFRWTERVGLQVFGAQHVAGNRRSADGRRGHSRRHGQLLVARRRRGDSLDVPPALSAGKRNAQIPARE